MQSTPRLRLELPHWTNFTVHGASSAAPEVKPEKETPAPSGDTGAAGSGSAGDDEEIRDPKARIRSLQEERDRHFRERQEAEKKLNERLEADRENELKSLSDAERTGKELEKAKREAEVLKEVNRRLSIENAFLTNNTVTWQSPEDALKLADLSKVEIDDIGTVKNPEAVTEAVTALSKSKGYLVKVPAEEASKTPKAPASGSAPQGAPAKTNGLDAGSLAAKYPALRGHIPG